MLAAIYGLLKALPDLVKLLTSMWEYINKVSGNDPAGFIVKAGEAFGKLNQAKTQQEHADAAKALADLINHLPSK